MTDHVSSQATSDKLLGGAMLFIAAFVFVYYTIWALLLVRSHVTFLRLPPHIPSCSCLYYSELSHHITAIPSPNIYHPLLLPSPKLRHQNPNILVAYRCMWSDIVFRKGHVNRSEEEEG